jgi:competence protein ComEC
LARGDRIEGVAGLAAIQVFHNDELLDPGPRQAQQAVLLSGSILGLEIREPGRGLGHAIDRLRNHARERIRATFAPRVVGMAQALVLGENNLSDDDGEAFRASGLAHLLAVSGTHLVFAVLGIMGLLRFYLLRVQWLALRCEIDRLVAMVAFVLTPLYADFAGGSGSAWRAAYMLCAALLAKVLSRRPVPSRALAASLAVGWLYDPLVAYDVSFLLSLAATVGLLTLGRGLSAWLGKVESRAVNFLQGAALATLSSMLPCMPILAVLSGSFTWASIGANVVAAPLGEAIALPLCLLHGLASPWPALERGIAQVASGALLVIQQVAYGSARVTWLRCPVVMPTSWQLVVLVTGGLTLFLSHTPRSRSFTGVCAVLMITGLFALEYVARVAGAPRGLLRITAVDVGQGDATLIDLPAGDLMLVDGGGIVGSKVDPGRRILEPLLRMRRRSRIDVLVLSHPHPDHFLGLVHVAEQFEIGEFWDTGQGEAHGAGPDYARLLATLRQRGVKILRPSELCGTRERGAATLQVLSPCPQYDPAQDANDNSFVIKIRHGAHSALLMGDAERHAEEALLAHSAVDLDADFLKVGHHGSRTSTSPAFLTAVSPRYASISCGIRNTFGHPHLPTLQTLQSQGVEFFRLDQVGAIQWQSDGTAETVRNSSLRDGPLWRSGEPLW